MTDIKSGDQAQWNGDTITRNTDTSNPAVHLKQDSGTDVAKRASELGTLPPSDSNTPHDGELRKPFPAPRQSAPISRPPDTVQEGEEANLSIKEQVELAEQRDKNAEGGDGAKVAIHGHTNGEKVTQPAEQLMDVREEVQDGEVPPGKQSELEASVGEKRARSEEPTVTSDERQSGSSENEELKRNTQEVVPEPESKKPRVEGSTTEVTDPTAPASTELNQTKPVETTEAPKKKAGRPKKEETKAATGERKNTVSSRTRSKANAEDVSI